MKKEFFTVRAIYGCFCILLSVYVIFTNVPYGQSSGFNYGNLLFALILLVVGIVQIIQRNRLDRKKKNLADFGGDSWCKGCHFDCYSCQSK